jgi:Helix-hairpin-helix motif
MDINNATSEQLEQVAQFDGERAKYLVEFRNRKGRFMSWEDMKRVRAWKTAWSSGCRKRGIRWAASGAVAGRPAHRPRPSKRRIDKPRQSTGTANRMTRGRRITGT